MYRCAPLLLPPVYRSSQRPTRIRRPISPVFSTHQFQIRVRSEFYRPQVFAFYCSQTKRKLMVTPFVNIR